jgi:hypothetical protein|tara:strand:+ start:127 stop:864 length:738 start_codon:yes stop_codon:yes gene_type:complete
MINANLPIQLKPQHAFKLIRLGKKNDGGYSIGYNSVYHSKVLISLGLSDDWSFEKHFKRTNPRLNILCFDDTLDLYYMVKTFFQQCLRFFFFRSNYLVRSFVNIFDYLFFIKKKIKKKRISYNDIQSITKRFNKKIFIKMDIEGSEYRVLNDLIKIKKKLTGLAIEFHDVDLNIKKILSFNKKIGLKLVNIHANSGGAIENNFPTTIELAYDKDPVVEEKFFVYPSKIDQINRITDVDIKILFKK